MASGTVFPTPPWPDSGADDGSCLSCFVRSVSLPIVGGTYTANVCDLASDSSMVSGRQCLAEALVRRLLTTRGTLVDDAEYGFDLRGYLNDDIDDRGRALIAAGIDAEMLKDERVINSKTAVAFVGGVLTVTVSITDRKGPFKLVLAVSSVSVSVLQV